MKILVIYLACLVGSINMAVCQSIDISMFSLLGIKEGFTSNQVTEVLQDSFGFIWVATKKGLNRYDGKIIIQYYADSNLTSLSQDEVPRMRMLPGNELASLTNSGLFVINTKTLVSKSIIIPADSLKYEYKVNGVMDVEGDEEGNIYLLTRSGLYAVDKNGKLWYRFDYYSANEAQNKGFAFGHSILKLSNSDYLLSTIAGARIFNKNEKTIKPLTGSYSTFFENINFPAFPFRSLYKAKDEFISLNDQLPFLEYYNLKRQIHYEIPITKEIKTTLDWRSKVSRINDTAFVLSGKEKGFYFFYFNPGTRAFVFDKQLRFEKYSCRAILYDKDKRWWIGTSKGLFKQNSQKEYIEKLEVPYTLYPDSTDINFREVNIINNKIYAASMEGLFIFDRDSKQALKRFNFSEFSQQSKNITSLELLNEDSLLIGPNGKMIVFNPKNYTYTEATLPGWDKTYWVPSIHTDKEGTLFICTNDEKLYVRKKGERFTLPKNLEGNPMYGLVLSACQVTDNQNFTWFCGHGISRYNPAKATFDFRMDSFPRMKIARREVLSLVLDNERNMYFSVEENGLIIFNNASKTFEQLTRSHGLPDNKIDALFLLDNVLWIGTASGIATYNIRTKRVMSYGSLDPEKPGLNFTGLSFYYDSIQHLLYAPCNNALIRLSPLNFKNRNVPPSFFIENIRINNNEIIHHPGNLVTLESGRKNLLVNIASINFDDAFNEQLYYRFKDRETWELVGEQKNFIISNLEDGTHDFEFMLVSKTNSWDPRVIALSVYIKPPFWKSIWFIILAGFIILSAIWLLYKARINRIRQKANIDKQLAELEMKSLHAQMNPHFIFNALNSIKEMIWENDKQNASRYLSKFAQLIRTTLEQSRQTFITVKQCVQHLEQYLEMEKIRFDDFRYSIETDKDLEWDEIQMAPMLVQPLVENAIWHGLKNTGDEKKLEIKFYQEGRHVVCEIADNGPGINHQAKKERGGELHRSISISNIHNRLQMLNEKYNMHCSLEFIDKADKNPQEHGTIAILRLSL